VSKTGRLALGDCDVCGNSRVRPGARRKEDLDACPRCAQIAEMQWVYHVEMMRAAAGKTVKLERSVA
jgi:hypothetical protein